MSDTVLVQCPDCGSTLKVDRETGAVLSHDETGPMLAVAGIREQLEHTKAPVLAVSPIVAGRAIKGPAAKMMTELGGAVSGLEVARLYANLIDAMLLDEEDRALLEERREDDARLFFAPTVMRTLDDRVALARECLRLLGELSGPL